jgi:hypothetical protein
MKKINISKYQHKFVELYRIKNQLNKLKNDEMNLRVELAEALTNNLPSGKHKFEFETFDVRIGKNEILSLDKKLLSDMYDDLPEEAQACIKFEPKLIEGSYNKLDELERYELDDCITRKPAAPTIDFIITGDL